MAGRTLTLTAKLLADSKAFTSGMDQATSRVDKFKNGVSKMTAPALAVVGGLAAVGVGAVKLAADAEQMQGGMEAVFGSLSKDVDKMSKDSANRLGMSGASYNQFAAQVGTSLKTAGVAQGDLVSETDKMISAGTDLASVFGGTGPEAVDAMSSAMRGQFDPLEKYGIIITAATVNERLKAKGLDKLTGAELSQAKAMETKNMILEQSAQYQGNFAKESNTLAGMQERLTAKFQDLAIKLGTTFLPVLTELAQKFAVVVDWISQNSQTVLILAGVLGGLAVGILLVNGAMKAWAAAQAVAKGAVVAFTAVQWLFNAAMAANPVALVVIALVALVAGVIIAYNKIGWFKDFVNASFKLMQEVVGNVANWIKTAWTTAFTAVSDFIKTSVANITKTIKIIQTTVGLIVSAVKTYFTNGFNAVKTFIQNTINNIKTTIQIIQTVTGVVVGAVKNFFSSAFSWVRGIVQGHINNIKATIQIVQTISGVVVGAVKSFFSGAFSWVVGIVQGHINNIRRVIGWVSDTAGAITGRVVSLFSGAFNWVASIVQGVMGGIRGAISWVADTASSVTSSVLNFFRNAFSSVSGVVMPIINGIRDSFNNITGAVQGVINTVSNLFSGFSPPAWLTKILGGGATGFSIDGGFNLSGLEAGLGATGSILSLGRSGSGSGPSTNITNVYVEVKADATTDKVALGREISNVLKTYQRTVSA